MHEDWSEERERLRRAKEEWESRMRSAEENISNAAQKVETGLLSLASFQAQHQHSLTNGSAKPHTSGGLVTPPSPRSLSAESTRPRQRRKRVSASRGRTRSRSLSPPVTDDGTAVHDADGSEASSFSGPRRRSPWSVDDSSDSEGLQPSDRERGDTVNNREQKMPFPITPESSVVNQPISTKPSVVASVASAGSTTDARAHQPPKAPVSRRSYSGRADLLTMSSSVQVPYQHVSQVFGIAVLAVAAAAVFWRVKPEVSA